MTAAQTVVTKRSPDSLSVRLGDEELELPLCRFPWFEGATAEQVSDVQEPSPGHLRWPQLDVDLTVESIRRPAAFLLVFHEPTPSRKLALAASKTIEMSSQDEIVQYEETARRFLREVLDYDLDECVISDESSLSDFASCGLLDELANPTETLQELYAAWYPWILLQLKRR